MAHEILGGKTHYGLFRGYEASRNFIRYLRNWVMKYEAGTFNDGFQAADVLQGHETRIVVPQRVVGGQALGIEFQSGSDHAAPPTERVYIRRCRAGGMSITRGSSRPACHA